MRPRCTSWGTSQGAPRRAHRRLEDASDGDVQVAVRPEREAVRAQAERTIAEVVGWRHAGQVQEACVMFRVYG